MTLITEFQVITSMIEREDIGRKIEEKFTPIQQQEMLAAMKGILTDELIFVMACKETELNTGGKQ